MKELFCCKTIADAMKVLKLPNIEYFDLIKDVKILNTNSAPYRLADSYKYIKSALLVLKKDSCNFDTIAYAYIKQLGEYRNNDKLFLNVLNKFGNKKSIKSLAMM
jgi:hypothetical protein